MKIATVALLVPDYDEGIAFYVDKLGFDLLEDTQIGPGKRWIRVAPKGAETALVLTKTTKPEQQAALGRQTGGGVGFFLQTDDFAQTHADFLKAGVAFREKPRKEPYGTVAVFSDPWGTCWDLIEPTS
ncbi:VOC family protein [Aestuariispira insulae]|uniref:Catechol 2,3-dioxygenase-like lactoylglutathione lyase family enzyme n=1 Tax=Aestuariispira insulae TaxID=1461337 RepID=A0A3D9HDW7_9PROT|nr:VOC family protein [Aestuariispira insulae]RED47658.1 catechol 2,3-dioxygenase-like lactoylglutathione lyase family enzyme [Aestuariispira insulae]